MDSTSSPDNKKAGMPRADFIMALTLMLLGLLGVHQSLQLPTFEKDWGGFYAAPGFVPLMLALTIFALSLKLFIRALRAGGHRCLPSREAVETFVGSKRVRRYCLAMIYSWTFYFILGHVQFYLATFLILFAFMATFSTQKIYLSLTISIVASLAIYLVFAKIFLVPLP